MAPRASKCQQADDRAESDGARSARAKAPPKKPALRPASKRNAPAKPKPETDDDSPQPSSSDTGPSPTSSDPATEPDSDAEPAPKRTRRTGAKSAAPGTASGAGKAAGARPRQSTAAAGKAAEAAGTGVGVGERGSSGPRYFLMKSEPEEFSLDDLAAKEGSTSHWEGVRNAQARNIMRSMKLGDEAFFYHSSCKVPAVVGLVRVVREAYPDHFAFNKGSKYYDARSTPDSPKWWMVDVQLTRRMARPVTLAELRAEGAKGGPIQDMVLINKSRLSVQPVTAQQWERILQMEAQGASEATEGRTEVEGDDEEAEKKERKPKARGKAK